MPEKDRHPIHCPHDRFFKVAFGHLEVARQLVEARLPPELVAGLDWHTLRLEPDSYVDKLGAEHLSDLVFSVQWRGRPLRLYFLFEHQSTPSPAMPLRLLSYMVGIWEDEQRQTDYRGAGSPILPIVLYQGKAPWAVPVQFHDWLALPAECRDALAPFQPGFSYVLVDLGKIPVEELRGRMLWQLVLGLMKAAREDRLVEWLMDSATYLGELQETEDKAELVRVMLQYLFHLEGRVNYSTFARQVAKVESAKVKEGLMTIAEELIEKGRQEGQQEGWQKGQQEGWQKGQQEGWQKGQQEGWQKGQQEGWQKGQQEGLERGRTIGRIQTFQDLLNLPVTSVAELSRQETAELQALLLRLEAQVRGLAG